MRVAVITTLFLTLICGCAWADEPEAVEGPTPVALDGGACEAAEPLAGDDFVAWAVENGFETVNRRKRRGRRRASLSSSDQLQQDALHRDQLLCPLRYRQQQLLHWTRLPPLPTGPDHQSGPLSVCRWWLRERCLANFPVCLIW